MTTLSYEVFPPNSTVGINHLNQVLTSLRDLSPDFISVTCNSNTKQLAHETVRVADYVENDCQVPAMVDIHSPRIPSVDEVKATINRILAKIAAPKVWINPDCGLKTRGVEETRASLANVIEATREVRRQLGEGD